MKTKKFEREIPEKKLRTVVEIVKLIKESKSIVIVSIKNLPTSQFQLIKKKLRGNAVIRVVKKNIILKAIDESKGLKLQEFKQYIKEDTALIFSNLDTFELSAILAKNKSKSRAKVGQEAEEDVVIEPGATELVPGPVISELSALGLKFSIEDGKINIREKKIILKKGQKINEAQASIMSKLDMKPVSVGLEPLVAYDSTGKIYHDIKVDQEKILNEMRILGGKALAFAVKLAYPCKETIKLLLAKANSQEKALSKLIKTEEVKLEK